LIRFAVLYADQILIPDPFWDFERRADDPWSRRCLLDDLAALGELRPLMDVGLLGLAPPDLPVCQAARPDFDKAQAELNAKLDLATSALLKRYRASIKARVVENYGPTHVLLTGPDDLVEHGAIEIHNLRPPAIKKIKNRDRKTIDRLICTILIDPIMNDMLLQDGFSRFYGFRYLTDRPDDLTVLSAINSNSVEAINAKAQSALRHSLPVVNGLNTKALIRLRQGEGESFLVYREALNAVLREVPHNDEAAIKQAFEDLVRPELHRLDKAVVSARKLVRRSLRDTVVIGTGLVCIGVFGGFLPADAARVLSWLGGAKYISDVLKKASELVAEPSSVRDSNFYFLWRALRTS
jgi:hypothetical protein